MISGGNGNEDRGGTTISVAAGADVLRALDRFAARQHDGLTREQAASKALEEWARVHNAPAIGGEGIRPENLNASNDD